MLPLTVAGENRRADDVALAVEHEVIDRPTFFFLSSGSTFYLTDNRVDAGAVSLYIFWRFLR